MRYLFLAPALAFTILLGGCDLKLKTDKPVAVVPKPVTCARTINRDVPQAFQSVGTAAGAVRTEACDTLVVGANPQGEIVLAKYDTNGNPDESFGDRAVAKPLRARYESFNVRIQRLAVINNGYFALGTYGRGPEPRALFIFRFTDTGFLDLSYGPLRDGTARAPVDPSFNLLTVGAPVIESGQFRLRNRGEDLNSGTEAEREQTVLSGGSQAMVKELQPVPASCELLNHDGFKQQTQFQLRQKSCGELSMRTSGPYGNDQLAIAVNGSSYDSAVLGEMRWFYEGRTMVLMSRDGLGFVKKEYANFVQGQTSICGTLVNPAKRYLVLSRKPSHNTDWLTDCWFL